MHEEIAQFTNSINNRKSFLFVASSSSKLHPKKRYKTFSSDMIVVVEGELHFPPASRIVYIENTIKKG
jgi:hypothetical protein